MVDDLLNNSKLQSSGYPVTAIIFGHNDIADVVKSSTNLTTKGVETKYLTHAEYLCIKELEMKNLKGFDLIVTVPPCDDCLNSIIKSKINIKNIIYLIEKDKPIDNNYKKRVKDSKKTITKVGRNKLSIVQKLYFEFICLKFIEGKYTSVLKRDDKSAAEEYYKRLEEHVREIIKILITMSVEQKNLTIGKEDVTTINRIITSFNKKFDKFKELKDLYTLLPRIAKLFSNT